jgi:hypothetical protein
MCGPCRERNRECIWTEYKAPKRGRPRKAASSSQQSRQTSCPLVADPPNTTPQSDITQVSPPLCPLTPASGSDPLAGIDLYISHLTEYQLGVEADAIAMDDSPISLNTQFYDSPENPSCPAENPLEHRVQAPRLVAVPHPGTVQDLPPDVARYYSPTESFANETSSIGALHNTQPEQTFFHPGQPGNPRPYSQYQGYPPSKVILNIFR